MEIMEKTNGHPGLSALFLEIVYECITSTEYDTFELEWNRRINSVYC